MARWPVVVKFREVWGFHSNDYEIFASTLRMEALCSFGKVGRFLPDYTALHPATDGPLHKKFLIKSSNIILK
jgi:hypothetical protein